MSKKTILKISLLLVLFLLLLIIAYLLLFYDFSHKDKNLNIINDDSGNTRLVDSEGNKKDLAPVKEEKIVKQESNTIDNDAIKLMLKRKSSFFAERFGTYSNQSNFDNIKDLEIFMTDDMKKWAEDFVKAESNKEYSGYYSGVIVKSIKSNVSSLDIDNGFAVVVVDVQRIKSDKDGDKAPEMAKLRINFVNNDNNWLVNKADWR